MKNVLRSMARGFPPVVIMFTFLGLICFGIIEAVAHWLWQTVSIICLGLLLLLSYAVGDSLRRKE